MLQSFVDYREAQIIDNDNSIPKEVALIDLTDGVKPKHEDQSHSDDEMLNEIKIKSKSPPRIDTFQFIDEPSECFDEFISGSLDQEDLLSSKANNLPKNKI